MNPNMPLQIHTGDMVDRIIAQSTQEVREGLLEHFGKQENRDALAVLAMNLEMVLTSMVLDFSWSTEEVNRTRQQVLACTTLLHQICKHGEAVQNHSWQMEFGRKEHELAREGIVESEH